jgi:hypothetical protein
MRVFYDVPRTATGCELHDREIEVPFLSGKESFLFSAGFGLALRSTQPLTHCVLEAFPPGLWRPGYSADHSAISNFAAVHSHPPICLHTRALN